MPRPKTPDDEQRTEIIAVRTTQAVKDAVQVAAGREGRTVSDWMLRLVLAALKRKGGSGA